MTCPNIRRRDWLLATMLAALGCAKQPSTPSSARTAIELQLNWFPEVEHAGYYAALVEGFYAEAGLDVTILPGGPDTPVIAQVANGRADFGVTNGDGLLFGRAQNAPVVALMAPLQTSPRCLIVHKKSGITSFDGLKNITIGLNNSQAFYHYLKAHTPLDNVRIVPYLGNVARFLTDENFAQQGYVFSEPFLAEQQGGDPQVLMLADLGYNPYASVLFSTDDRVKNDPALVEKMVHASIRGWQHYLTHPEKTNAELAKLNPEMHPDALAFGAKAIQPLVLPNNMPETNLGEMTLERWQTNIAQLEATKQLTPGSVKSSDVVTKQFSPSPSETIPAKR